MQVKDDKVHYNSFTLNGTEYSVGDAVLLFPEDESYKPNVAKVRGATVLCCAHCLVIMARGLIDLPSPCRFLTPSRTMACQQTARTPTV
jgi:hypothetical protein